MQHPRCRLDYCLGGYSVLKKWLSYRESDIIGRALKPEEVQYVSEVSRRISAIILSNYSGSNEK